MNVRHASARFAICLTMASLVGCGTPDYYQCEGVVTHEGKPVGPLLITFEPENPEAGRPPSAMSDKDGKFKMETGREAGVPPGNYLIHVVDPVAADGRKMSTAPEYLYVIDRYSPEKTDVKYTADSHQSNFELKLDKKEYTGPPVRKAAEVKNTTG